MQISIISIIIMSAIGILFNVINNLIITFSKLVLLSVNTSLLLITIFCAIRIIIMNRKKTAELKMSDQYQNVDNADEHFIQSVSYLLQVLRIFTKIFPSLTATAIDKLEQMFEKYKNELEPEILEEERGKILSGIKEFIHNEISGLDPILIRTVMIFFESYHKFPYIQRLLNKVIEKTEEAAFVLIDKIGNVSKLQNEAVLEANQGVAALNDSASNVDFSVLVASAKNTSNKNRSILNEIIRFNQDNVKNVNDIEALIKKTNNVLSSIIEISERNKVITLNLAIEAAKVGSKASSFKIISQQIHKLNNDMGKFIREINDTIEQLKQYNDEMLKSWVEKNHLLVETVEENMKKISEEEEAFMQRILGTYQMTTSLFQKLSNTTFEVKRNLDKTVEALQFQDITRQQIQNVSHFLKEIEDDIKRQDDFFSLFGHNLNKEDVEIMKKIKHEFKKVLKVSDEHEALV